MRQDEQRHRVIAALLEAAGPQPLEELRFRSGLTEDVLRSFLSALTAEGLAVEGHLLPGTAARQYCWAARWEAEARRLVADRRRELQAILGPLALAPGVRPDIDSEPTLAFHRYVIDQYRPPGDKRSLVFAQCSVRRPFSSSPSHASIRRAISAATGLDPCHDFERCPVHIVVLASKVGPVPYELEDIYPANVRGGGVKHFGRDHYERLKPVLAERMAQYITVHGRSYDRIAAFTDGRYGEVMQEARQSSGTDFRIFPARGKATILRMGGSTPRNYWEKYWIQLCLEIVSWLEPGQRQQAHERLADMGVEYLRGSAPGE